MKLSAKTGFTLIEILVVVAIIGLLAGTVLVSMKGAAAKARDAIRKTDINQIEKALWIYFNGAGNGQFPSEACTDSSIGSDSAGCGCPACGTGPCTGTNWCTTSQIFSQLSTNKIITLPKDPVNNTTHYYYYEPCCNQDCGGGRTCIAKGCCEYTIAANRLEGGGSYSKWGRGD